MDENKLSVSVQNVDVNTTDDLPEIDDHINSNRIAQR